MTRGRLSVVWSRGAAACVLLAVVAACPPRPPAFDCSTCATTAPKRTINLLVRSLLPRGSTERRTYAFHAYLFFGDRTSRTEPARLAAAMAVIGLFSDVRDVSKLRIPEDKLAILHVMVGSQQDVARIKRLGAPIDLVQRYDYDRARLIKRDLETKTRIALPEVALLGSPLPLIGAPEIDPARLYVVDLGGITAREVEDRVAQFGEALESRRSDSMAALPTAATLAGGYFKRIGVALGSK